MPRNIIRANARNIGRTRIALRAHRFHRPSVPDLEPVERIGTLNGPESRIAKALTELGIRFRTQVSVLGGSILGGAKTDFDLLDYATALEYNGPFHSVTQNTVRDVLRNVGVTSSGKRIIVVNERHLPYIKPFLLAAIGRPV
jgi:hypothetical protein